MCTVICDAGSELSSEVLLPFHRQNLGTLMNGKIPTQPKIFDHFQTYIAIYHGHSELSRVEKSKFRFEEKSSVYY